MRRPIEELIAQLFPGAEIERVRAFGADEDIIDDATEKAAGYGEPVRVTLRTNGHRRDVVLHTASADDFGHDRRADRAAEMLLGFDTFGDIPRHVEAIDVGFITADGSLRSERDAGEAYLVTEYAPGTVYAHDLRELSHGRQVDDRDRRRCDALADYLIDLHADHGGRAAVYTRAIRDLVGHGEGIFGLIDGYPADVPAAPPARLQSIERRCIEWRWKLRDRTDRLCRTHGDFHPFNILFDGDHELALLDAARGCRGDAADDVVCIALNYVFFAVGHEGAWHGVLGELWKRLWQRYLDGSGDPALLEVAPPFVAWRGLVMANPTWYPQVDGDSRDTLLTLIEQALEAERFDPDSVEALFR